MHISGISNIGTPSIEAESIGYGVEGNVDSALWGWASPEAAACATVEIYGSSAVTAAAYCALTARYDGRDFDYRFWILVFKLLRSGDVAALQNVSVTGSC